MNPDPSPAKESKPSAPAKPAKAQEAKAPAAKEATPEKASRKPRSTEAPKGAAEKRASKAAAKAPAKETKKDEVKIVEKATPKKHVAQAKPTLSKETVDRMRLRAAIDGRRPRFRRQQWYEYKRLADSGWRKPTGVDSAMRRHFGYEQSVVRVGFRGPVETRGLHPSGFQEVRVETIQDLGRIDPKKQAARVSGNLGTRKLKLVYAEADKRGVRVLNRRQLE